MEEVGGEAAESEVRLQASRNNHARENQAPGDLSIQGCQGSHRGYDGTLVDPRGYARERVILWFS